MTLIGFQIKIFQSIFVMSSNKEFIKREKCSKPDISRDEMNTAQFYKTYFSILYAF
jgi:hypothetical protein